MSALSVWLVAVFSLGPASIEAGPSQNVPRAGSVQESGVGDPRIGGGHHHGHHRSHDHHHHRRFRASFSLSLPGFFPGFPFCHSYSYFHSVDFYGPSATYYPAFPIGYVEYVPSVVWLPPIVEWPVGPPVAMEPPAPPLPVVPRGATTDVPERVLDQLLPARQPSLAQRARAARYEGGGDLLFRAGHADRAAERYQQALSYTPDHDELKFKLGAAFLASRRFDRAGQVLRDALRIRPDWPHVRHDLTTLFPDGEAIQQVADELERQALRPNADADLHFLRAYLLYFSGRRDEAELLFRDVPAENLPPHYRVFQRALDQQRGR